VFTVRLSKAKLS